MNTPMKVKSNDEFGLLAQSFNNMLNNVQTKTAELIYERNRSKMILAQLPDGIIVTDLNHKLLLANRAAETMLGFSTDSAKGQALIRYLKDENLQSFFSSEMDNIQSSQMVRGAHHLQSTREENQFQITLSPLLDSTYQKTGLITVIRNITKETHARTLKDHFLRAVTHELRTPLTSIIGFLNILKKEMHGNLNEKQREFLSIAIFNSSMLKKLINNLLDLSMIQSGSFKLQPIVFTINDTLDDTIHQLLPSIEKKQNTIFIDYQDEHMLIDADQARFKQMIENLILNANKNTDQGKIECIVTKTLSNISIIIKDNGIGLSKEEKFAIYQAFELQSGAANSYKEGVNIELAIVKELVHLHNGSIHLESDVEQGSTYTVSLPQKPNLSLPISKDTEDVTDAPLDHFHPQPLSI